MGLQNIPDLVDEVAGSGVALTTQPPDPDPVHSQQARVELISPGPVVPGGAATGDRRSLRPRRPTSYRDNRAWTRRKMLAGFLGISTTPSIFLPKGVDIEMA